MTSGPRVHPVSIDVGSIVQRTVASLYSHLVTRPTGRAVRLAIERRMEEAGDRRALSLVDLSEVRVLDFSCADEVVAKLLLRFSERRAAPEAFFVFLGVGAPHRDPIEEVLLRRSLCAVAETGLRRFELLGDGTRAERRVWTALEEMERLDRERADEVFSDGGDRFVLDRLVRRGVALELPELGQYRALSTLVPTPSP